MMRAPTEVMRLERMGASFQTRLSFMRTLIRRISRENWRFKQHRFDVDADGYGVSVFCAHTSERVYSLIIFTSELAPEKRTDRVIAEAWDATFNLFDGIPGENDISRLAVNTPKQEAGRFLPSELVLARANKSLRLFEHIVSNLANGDQPDIELVSSVGYLMRTTAVYGSGKFGCADRDKIADRPETQGAFQVEMLAVYLFRWFTVELVEHVARARGGESAVGLHDDIKRYLGIGNSTGLGMAPFLVKHPVLIHNWVSARETALARVRNLDHPIAGSVEIFHQTLANAIRHIGEWTVEDHQQTERIARLREDITDLSACALKMGFGLPTPWNYLYQHALETYSLEGQELTVALLLEPHGDLIDDLTNQMFATEGPALEPEMAIGQLRKLIAVHYDWALTINFDAPSAQKNFWYYSEDKLEPRFGDRATEPGAELEMPLAIGRDVARLSKAMDNVSDEGTIAVFLCQNPEFRHVIRRVQTIAHYPYAEINDNLIGGNVRPLDLLRFKLAFFGASKFDPKSDLWTRICMYQGAPMPDDLSAIDPDAWAFPIKPEVL